MFRIAFRRAVAVRPRAVNSPPSYSRRLSAAAGKGVSVGDRLASTDEDREAPRPRQGLMARLFRERDGRNPLLSALGYYSKESIALGAGTSAYDQLRARAESAARTFAVGGKKQPFALRFEMLSVHVYLTLRRLRREKGSPFEADCTTVMQCVFDVFWTDVRNRMLIDEEGLTLIPSGRWVRECEQMFFGMALAFDDAWEDKEKFSAAIERNITSVPDSDVQPFFKYMWAEKERLDAMPMETFLEQKEIWSPDFILPRRKRY